jgi:hypothetical protein
VEQNQCQGFRRELVSVLAGRPRPLELRHLSWHEHLLGCTICRDLLEREEALELLLATLPEPRLSPDLTRRVVRRLEAEVVSEGFGLDSLLDLHGACVPAGLAGRVRASLAGERELDRVLDQWSEPQAPAGLAARISEGLGETLVSNNELALDALLDMNTAPSAPAGLSQEILNKLEGDRVRKVPRLRLLSRMPRFAAAAALLLALLSAPMWMNSPDQGPGHQHEKVASVEIPNLPGTDEVDPSLLAMLDMLENDELWAEGESGSDLLLIGDDDIHLLLEQEIGVSDEMLLAYFFEEDESTSSEEGR